MSTLKFDVIVIGSGGGTKLVRPVAALGKNVAIIERWRLGGTCLNRGCIPSKMLIHHAELVSEYLEMRRFDFTGVEAVPPKCDFEKIVSKVNKTVEEDSDSIPPLYERTPGVQLFRGCAKFESDHVVRVGDDLLEADKVFIAVGGRPRVKVDVIEGLEGTPFWTSTEALQCRQQPKKMIILGGGFIAAELGYFFGELGTHVEFVVRSCLLRQEDVDVRKEFSRVFREKWNVHIGYTPYHVRFDDEKKIFHVRIKHHETGDEMECDGDALLVAHGIQPNTDDLGLQNTSIEVDHRGFIRVDDHLRTTASGVWALGDCIGRYQYRHTVNFEGEYLFKSIFQTQNGKAGPLVYSHVPHAVFSRPQVGAVGKTEDEMREDEGAAYVVAINSYASSAMGMALKSDHGFVKLVVDRETRKILGGHVIGPQASTMIHIIASFMYFEGTADDMVKMIWAHPALPEVIRNAARKAVQLLDQ
eukprot:TRINITY_DN2446_c0_g1_i1.p1 TRINITY_DN2446_c0_g1~~TRINITY_DN2446_c0_g1_i1.p1  ORF type:complete len:480 (-),score=136.72 TRINITY_DN2446_c0_g1_i1:1143-2558(-)